MSIYKNCGSWTPACPYGDHRCPHTWLSRLMIDGQRHPTVKIDDYARARGARGHVVTKREADAWEAQIILDWRQGRDPRLSPHAQTLASTRTVATTLADYAAVAVPKLSVAAPARSEIRHIADYFGTRALTDLEREAVGFEFMTALREGWRPGGKEPLEDGRGPVAVHRIMQRLRNVINWCIAQHPPLLTRTPFHRHGLVLKTTQEAQRTRRLQPGEEMALLRACDLTSDADHGYAGLAIKRRILGALYLGARGSELDRVRVGDIDWRTWIVKLRHGKSAPRSLAVAPGSALAEALAPRRFLKSPHDAVFGDERGRVISHRTAWETVLLLAHDQIAVDGAGRTAAGDAAAIVAIDLHFHDLRRECGSRWYETTGHDIRRVQEWLGHKHVTTTQIYLQIQDVGNQAADMARILGYAAAKEGL